MRYPTVKDAKAAGMVLAGGMAPGVGAHYQKLSADTLKGVKADGTINAAFPGSWIYAGTGDNDPVVGVMPVGHHHPTGFAGPNDHWHQHSNLCIQYTASEIKVPFAPDSSVTPEQCASVHGDFMKKTVWMVHAWVVPGWESPQGVFSHANLHIYCPGNTYLVDPLGFCVRQSGCDGSVPLRRRAHPVVGAGDDRSSRSSSAGAGRRDHHRRGGARLAHATLVASSPTSGQHLAHPPATITLQFDQRVVPTGSGLSVLNSAGTTVSQGHATNPMDTVVIHLRPGLPDGAYVADYTVDSADGHIVSGGVVFLVGVASPGRHRRPRSSQLDRGRRPRQVRPVPDLPGCAGRGRSTPSSPPSPRPTGASGDGWPGWRPAPRSSA